MKKFLAIFVLCFAVFAANAQKSTGLAPRQQAHVNGTVASEAFRSLQTEAIVAVGGTNFNHFTLGNPSSLTSYGTTASEFTNSCEYFNLNYYFATSTSGQFGTINPATGVQTIIRTGNNCGSVAYNHADNTMYGASLGSSSTLYTIDPATGVETSVVTVTDDTAYFVMAMTITNDGRFIVVNASRESIDELNPTTGALTPLVPAGFNINYGQDIAVDRETNTVYWAAYNADLSEGQLYAVDLEGATLTLIGTFETQVAGFCPLNYSAAELNRPAAVSNFTATPDPDHGLSVDLAWTNPTLTIGGEALTALTSVELYRDGELLHSFANPTVGGDMTYTDNTMTADGAYNYVVYAVNEDGEGVEASARALVGNLCEYTIEMVDDWGDGWNGAAIEVYAGTTLMETATISSGDEATVLVPLPLGECSFVWVSGSYDSECSFTINDPFGVPVFIADEAPAAGTFLTIQNTCEAPQPFLNPNQTSMSFIAAVGVVSAASSVDILAYNPGTEVTATTAAPFEVSFDNATFAATATYSITEETETITLYVRFAPTEPGTATGTITLSAANVSDTTIALTGEGVDCPTITTFPYNCTFAENDATLLCWQIVDANGDANVEGENMGTFAFYGSSWSEGNDGVAQYFYSRNNAADDWLITPEFMGENLSASFEYLVRGSSYPEEFGVYVIPAGQTYENAVEILAPQSYTNTTFEEQTLDLSAYDNQAFRIAFHVTSAADMYGIVIDNFSIGQGIGINEQTANTVSIYPNPATTVLNVVAEGYNTIEIVNLLGQTVYAANATNNMQINVSNLNNGVYFVRVNGENGTTTQKFIKK